MANNNTGSFTNHSGIIEFKGKGYFFYHTGKLPGGGGYKRSTAIEEFDFKADGTIPTLTMSTTGPKPVRNFDPYVKVEGETMAFSSGLKTTGNDASGVYVNSINNNDYIKLRSVDFATTGAKGFSASVGASGSGASIELRLDSQTGKLIGTLPISSTGGMTTWKTLSTTVSGATGVHDLFLVFKGGSGDLFNLDSWQFDPVSTSVEHKVNATPTERLVDVYTPAGIKVRAGVAQASATKGLGSGIYFVGNKKVVVAP
jgi:hypothetical protein